MCNYVVTCSLKTLLRLVSEKESTILALSQSKKLCHLCDYIYNIIYHLKIHVTYGMSYFLRCSCSFRKSSVLLLFTPELFL